MAAALTGTPVALSLNATATPGAKTITVPSDAQYIVVQYAFYSDSDVDLSSITSTCCGTFTTAKLAGSGGVFVGVGVSYAAVTSTGTKTVTIAWTRALEEGPTAYVSFVKGIHATVPVYGTLTNQKEGSTVPSGAVTSATDALILVVQEVDSAAALTITSPACTSLGTSVINGAAARIQTVNSPSASSTTITGKAGDYGTLAAIAFQPAAAGGSFQSAWARGSNIIMGIQ